MEADLLQRPGVAGIDIGYKTVEGEKTDTLAIVVYVAEKRDVPPDERIPQEIQGIPTDVVVRRFKLFASRPERDE